MKRTVWDHKEVFQRPPRGVFRSRFLWDSLAVFTLRCSLTILQASCTHFYFNCSNKPHMVRNIRADPSKNRFINGSKREKNAALFCSAIRFWLKQPVLSDVSISSMMLDYIHIYFRNLSVSLHNPAKTYVGHTRPI